MMNCLLHVQVHEQVHNIQELEVIYIPFPIGQLQLPRGA